jgi:hypothetical protein
MPLQRSDQGVKSDGLDAIYFPMEDAETGLLVARTVTHGAVQRLIAQIGKTPTGDPFTDFELVRLNIEVLASRKYDEGEEQPFINSKDL